MNAILIDITKCTGCEKCVEACNKSNNNEKEIRFPKLSDEGLSARRFTSLVKLSSDHFAKKQCFHCMKPACEEACLVGAIKKTELGPVVYDASKCIGCRYCMLACPVGIPKYEWDKQIPYMKKCNMCYERQVEGKTPACVEACPQKAAMFGNYSDLLDKAKQTISQNPDKYINHVYGEKELGGTSVLYISDVPLDALGFPEKVGDRSIHSYTWPVLSKTPILAAGVCSFLSGTLWIVNRRMKLQSKDQGDSGSTPE